MVIWYKPDHPSIGLHDWGCENRLGNEADGKQEMQGICEIKKNLRF